MNASYPHTRRPIASPTRVVVALSGGVDSAVAAALLVEQGCAVSGMMLKLWAEPGAETAANRCCTPEGICRAIAVAEHLGIPFQLLNAEAEFKAQVVDYLVAEYAAGRTPNPCVPCNRLVRFGWLLDRALQSGAEFLATGHYARVTLIPAFSPEGGGRYQLLRGRDARKDQSYFLHTLTQAQLAHVLFPLGEWTKPGVRAIARARGLPVAEQPESQDLCFLADGDYRRFLSEQSPYLFRPGPIRDTSGHVLGQHQGLPAYTVGQRKGLGIAAAEPLYVLALQPEENALVVGMAAELGQDECRVAEMRYIAGEPSAAPFQAEAQIRYRARPVPVSVTPLPGGEVHVRFGSPQRDVTPGQFLVLYDGAVVLGGGVICGGQKSVL